MIAYKVLGALAGTIILVGCAVIQPPSPPTPPPPHGGPYASPVAFGQAFSAHVTTASQIPYAVMVWSDNGRLAAKTTGGPVFGLYTAAYRFKGAIPPGCLAVKADGSPAYEFGDLTNTPIAINDSVCLAAKEAEITASLSGQTVLSIDNVDSHNSYGITGTAAEPHRYTGGAHDGIWMADNLAYLTTLTAWAHRRGLKVWINDTGGSYDVAPTDWEALAAVVDGVAQEGWPLDGDYTDSTWKNGRALGKAFDAEYGEIVHYAGPVWMVPYLAAGAPADQANASNVTWVTAAYLLAWKAGNVLSLSTAARSSWPVSYPAAMSPPLGLPIDPPPPVGCRPCVRRFRGGTVRLDPVAGTASITWPFCRRQQYGMVARCDYTVQFCRL